MNNAPIVCSMCHGNGFGLDGRPCSCCGGHISNYPSFKEFDEALLKATRSNLVSNAELLARFENSKAYVIHSGKNLLAFGTKKQILELLSGDNS